MTEQSFEIKTEAGVEDVLAFKEERVRVQQSLREAYHMPVISFCMNIPGPVKTNERIRRAFETGKTQLRKALSEAGISCFSETEHHTAAGDEWIAAVDAPAVTVKAVTERIEETHPYGRLFDMDVTGPDGEKQSRAVPRTCLVCGSPAFPCARSRAHGLDALLQAVDRILETPVSG